MVDIRAAKAFALLFSALCSAAAFNLCGLRAGAPLRNPTIADFHADNLNQRYRHHQQMRWSDQFTMHASDMRLQRRLLIAALGSLVSGACSSGARAALAPLLSPVGLAANPAQSSPLQTRLTAEKLDPLSSIMLPFSPADVFYPDWLVGSWTVTATLRAKTYPFGTKYVLSKALIEGSPRNRGEKVGDSTTFEVRYIPKSAWNGNGNIANRTFNMNSVSRAYSQQTKPGVITWDPKVDPARLTVDMETSTGPDMRPNDVNRKVEIFITARATESDKNVFRSAEKSRSVYSGARSAAIVDQENVIEFSYQAKDKLTGRSRILIFLTPNPNSPEGILWQEVGGRAVALFDYDLQLERLE